MARNSDMLHFRAVILNRSSFQVFHFLTRVRNNFKKYMKKILFISIELFQSDDTQMLIKLMEAAFSIWAGRKALRSQKNNTKMYIFIYLFIRFHLVKIFFMLSYLWKNILYRFTFFVFCKCSQINDFCIFLDASLENNLMCNGIFFLLSLGDFKAGWRVDLMDLACLLTSAGTEEPEYLCRFAEK